MSATILDGKALAHSIQAELAEKVADFTNRTGVVPCLTAVLVGENPASEVYVRNKRKACQRLGVSSDCRLPRRSTTCSCSSGG